ncbi:MAG TPA: VOC family protein [Stellaceae bacterium]|jgi:lactoylglutathione lyase|nr:VOC family protein [Stellaceae bacterium]
MFKRIDHIEIVTDRLDETVGFYTDVLGFTVGAHDRVARPGSDTALNVVYLGLGGTTVELMNWEGVPVAPRPELEHLGYRMMAIEVDDMKEALAYLKTKGVDAAWGPVFRDNYARAEIEDPNGYRIELRHWF